MDGVLDILRDSIKTSHTKLAEYIDGYITDRIESGGMEGFTASLAEALFQKLKDGGAACIVKRIYERITDKNLPEHYPSKITAALLRPLYQYLRQNLQNIINVKIPRRYEAAFTGYIENHTLIDFAGRAGFQGFLNKLAEKIGGLPRKASSAIAKLAGRQTTDGRQSLKNCFGGAIPALIKNKGGLLNGIICKLAASQKPAIVSMIMDGTGGASFFQRLVRQAANALLREDVEAITDIVIDEKLFPFLQARRDAVFGILNGALESPLGFDCRVFNEEHTSPVLSGILASERVFQPLKNLSWTYLTIVSGEKLKNLLSPVNMDSIDGLMERASSVVNITVSEITLHLDDMSVTNRLNELFNDVILKTIGADPVSSLLRGTDTEAEACRISAMFFNEPAPAETTKIILKGLLQKLLSREDFYDHQLFRRDVSFFLGDCVTETVSAPCAVRKNLTGPLRGLLGNAGRLISAETRDAICGDYVLPAMLNACENQFPNLVDSLSLYSVVEREINRMPPREIEGVFYGFAGPYFKKIILYGWIGLFAGLLSYALGCLPLFSP